MGLLNGTRVYLAGPIERASDNVSWRETIRPMLGDMGIVVWDPLIKPEWFIKKCKCELTAGEQQQDLKLFEKYSKSEKVNLMDVVSAHNRSTTVRATCLRLVSSCDFIICNIDGTTVGTFEEMSKANDQGKPIIFLHSNGKFDSCWRYVQFNNAIHKYSINEVIDYLNNINKGVEEVDNKQWIFLPGRWPDASNTTARSDQQSRSIV